MATIQIASILLVLSAFVQGNPTCLKPIPGVRLLSRGVDLRYLDLTPNENFKDEFSRKDVVKFTCRNNESWVCPFTGVKYNRPDQVWLATTVPGGISSTDTTFIRNTHELVNSFEAGFGLKFSFFGLFDVNVGVKYKKTKTYINEKSKKIILMKAYQGASRVDLLPHWELKLSPDAQSYIDKNLQGKFETDFDKFSSFIKLYGTHYFSSGDFGGFIQHRIIINTQYFETTERSKVKVEAGISYGKALKKILKKDRSVSARKKYQLSSEKDVKEQSKSFSSNTKTTTKFYGGNAVDGRITSLLAWQDTVSKNPWQYSGKLEPIYNLVRDENVRENLRKATNNFLMSGILDELKKLMKPYARFPNQLHKDLMHKIKTISEFEKLESLKYLVKYHTSTPGWFKTGTKMCLKYKSPKYQKNRCNVGRSSSTPLCWQPNSETHAYYHDNSRRGTTCIMQWAITTPKSSPAWFKKVELCFMSQRKDNWNYARVKYTGYFQKYTRYAINTCVSIDKYTDEYRDKSEWSASYLMTWKLKVPKDAPLWALTLRFCFFWKNTESSGQCGANAPDTQNCVFSNAWLPIYQDTSKDTSGGSCKMRWGWFSGDYYGNLITKQEKVLNLIKGL